MTPSMISSRRSVGSIWTETATPQLGQQYAKHFQTVDEPGACALAGSIRNRAIALPQLPHLLMSCSLLVDGGLAGPAYRLLSFCTLSVCVIHAATVPAARAAFHVRQERP